MQSERELLERSYASHGSEGYKSVGCMELVSEQIPQDGWIPTKHTARGADISPSFTIKQLPPGTESMVLIVDDIDTPGGHLNHWTVWDMPPTTHIEEGKVPSGACEGRNDFGQLGFIGPCPPKEEKHRYRFVLYALDTLLRLAQGSRRERVLDSIRGHVLDWTSFTALSC